MAAAPDFDRSCVGPVKYLHTCRLVWALAVTLRFCRSGVIAFVFTVATIVVAAEMVPRPVTSESGSNAPLIEKSSLPSPQTAGEDRLKIARGVHPASMIIAGLFGFVFSLAYLLTKLTKYWGLRVLRNGWSVGFLVSGTVFSVLCSPFFSKMIGSHGFASLASLESLPDLGSSVGASLVGSGFISGVQRLFGRRRSANGDAAKDNLKSNAKGFLFDRIGESLQAQINQEIGRLSEELDWPTITAMATKIIIAGQTAEDVAPEKGDKALKEIEQLAKTEVADGQADNLNKYKALNRVLSCVSFKTLRREYQKTPQRPP